MSPHMAYSSNFILASRFGCMQVPPRVKCAWLALSLVVMGKEDAFPVRLDPTHTSVEQVRAQFALQGTFAKAAQARLGVLSTAHHQHLRTTLLDASAMQATAGRMAEAAPLAVQDPFVLESQIAQALSQHSG
jgi:hypothetical protein